MWQYCNYFRGSVAGQVSLDVEHWRAKSEKTSGVYDTLKKLEASVPCQPGIDLAKRRT